MKLDEATATALAMIIHNHIEALRVWERKLRTPYMPTTRNHMSLVPDYPKPTLATMVHIARSGEQFTNEVVRMAEAVDLQHKKEEAL